jgi:hypothetical protein
MVIVVVVGFFMSVRPLGDACCAANDVSNRDSAVQLNWREELGREEGLTGRNGEMMKKNQQSSTSSPASSEKEK